MHGGQIAVLMQQLARCGIDAVGWRAEQFSSD
jgi:hypothetical protein